MNGTMYGFIELITVGWMNIFFKRNPTPSFLLYSHMHTHPNLEQLYVAHTISCYVRGMELASRRAET